MNRRALILGGALLATLAASWWTGRLDDGRVPGADRPPARGEETVATSPPAPPAPLERLGVQREAWLAWEAAVLQPMSFAPPPSPTPPVQRAPSAPPLPFRYVGAIEGADERAVILMDGDAVHVVRARQRIGERYRVERISPTEIEFTYLPLRQRQLLGTSVHEKYQ